VNSFLIDRHCWYFFSNWKAMQSSKGKEGLSPSLSKSKSVRIKGGIGNVETFMGKRPPQEIKNLVDLLPKVNLPTLKRICSFAFEYLKNTKITPEQWQKLLNGAKELEEQEANMILSGILLMLKTALRERIEPEAFQETCENLTIVGEKQGLLANVYRNIKMELKPGAISAVSLPHLVDANWRVDVTISTSEIERVLKPTVLLRLTDSSGNIRQMELNPETFHQLRYAVARLLKEMENIESLGILKIDKTS